MSYVRTVKFVTTKDIETNYFSFSPANYEGIVINNKEKTQVKNLLDRTLTYSDKGIEVGSNCYVNESPYYFMRTKALQADYFLPQIDSVSTTNILPNCFRNKNLKSGDLLISKDSNIGEAVILDKDYPNFMISGGLYKLPVSNNKLYLLAFLKTEFFKKQLYSLVSRGSTLKHAKTLFLDCYIPFPKNDKVITYVEKLVNALLNKELEIKNKHYLINEVIQNELKNQNDKNLKLSYPSLKDISLKSRIDTGTYTTEFQTIDFQIKNYVNGFTQIPENNISSGNTPTERKISSSDEYENLWITPTSISDFGTIMNYETIRCKQNNLNSNALLIINRTSRGEEGEYVGISTFYDYSEYGKGHHNQGIYKVKNLPDEDLIFLASCLNSALWRKYCGRLSLGSKMKEIKASQVASIPFPNFPKNIKLQINKLYFDQPINMKDSNDYLEFDSNWNKEAGILQLNKSYRKTKQFLQNLLINLIQGEPIEIKFSKELLY